MERLIGIKIKLALTGTAAKSKIFSVVLRTDKLSNKLNLININNTNNFLRVKPS